MRTKPALRQPAAFPGVGMRLLFSILFPVLTALTVSAQVDAPTTGQIADATSPATVSDARPAHNSSTTSTPTETASSTYRLQPYDLIDIDVYSEEDLHKPARLGADGTVILPLIGSVKVGGMTVAEATDLITKRYAAGFVKNPSVLITVLQYRKATFSLLGQVTHPGIFEIPEGAHVTILDALSMAGGFTATAAQNSVTVRRTVDGKETIVKVNAGDMEQSTDITPFELMAGDAVMVPVAPAKQNSFTVLGQVSKPGLFPIPDGTHVMIIDAISMAGGPTVSASQSSVTIKRTTGDKTHILKVNISDIAQNPNASPVEILPGDIIFVPFRSSTFSILGQVSRPGIYEVPEGSHINIVDAVLMAGGFTRTAAQNSVLVKRTVNGKITSIKVHAGDMASEANVVPFEVLPGDIIKVSESIF